MECLVRPILTSLIGTLVGAVLGGLVAYHFGKKLADRQQIKQAALAFTKAFLDELKRLEAQEDLDTYSILSPAFAKHEAAVYELMFHLPKQRQAELKTVWHLYYYDLKTGIPFLEQYADGGVVNERKSKRDRARERIQKLIDFAAKT
ncbi:MAG: hypothetical protein WB930_09240 [Syntrophobacteraceae bacterium]